MKISEFLEWSWAIIVVIFFAAIMGLLLWKAYKEIKDE